MKRLFLLALVAFSAPATAQPLARSTTKGVEPFAQCFAAAQDRAARPWSFVPREGGGGTFSNLGANGVRHPYFLEVADRGARREIKLSSEAPNRNVLRAVDRCI
jgi:hypothetical protein